MLLRCSVSGLASQRCRVLLCTSAAPPLGLCSPGPWASVSPTRLGSFPSLLCHVGCDSPALSSRPAPRPGDANAGSLGAVPRRRALGLFSGLFPLCGSDCALLPRLPCWLGPALWLLSRGPREGSSVPVTVGHFSLFHVPVSLLKFTQSSSLPSDL